MRIVDRPAGDSADIVCRVFLISAVSVMIVGLIIFIFGCAFMFTLGLV